MKICQSPYKEFIHGDCVISVFRIRYFVHDHWVEGFLAIPKGAKKLPGVIYNRGGSFAFGEIDDHLLKVHVTKLASLGYVVIASQYSGNGGSEGKDEVGGKEIEDVLVLKEYLQEIPEADGTCISMFGASRGGMMTLRALQRVTWIKSAVIIGAMTNLDRMLVFRPEMAEIFEKGFGNTEEGRYARSAVRWTAELAKQTPLLIMHGTADNRVPLEDAQELARECEKHRIPHKLIVWEGAGHSLKECYQEYWKEVKKWIQ